MLRTFWLVLCVAVLQSQDPSKGSIEGLVVRAGAANQQLANSAVELRPGNFATGTGGSGAFAFSNLAPGRYTISVKRDGFVIQEDPQHGLTAAGLTVTVAAGQALRNVAIPMIPAPVIFGQVYDPFGQPLAAAVVQAYARRYTPDGPQLQMVKRTLTNDQGEFRLFWLNFGEYVVNAAYGDRLLASALNGVRLSANVSKPDDGYTPIYFGGALQASQAQSVRLAPGADAGSLKIELNDTAQFRVRGRIVSPSPPPPSVTITFADEGGDLVDNPNSSIRTAANGSFEIRNVSPGSYVLLATANHYSSALIPVIVDRSDVDGVSVSLSPAVDINGRILLDGNSNASFPGARVTAVRSSREVGQQIAGPVMADGTFTLPNVVMGQYDISVESIPAGVYIKSIRYRGIDGLPGKMLLLPDALTRMDIVLAVASATVQGRVDNGSAPSAGTQVVLVPEAGLRRRTDRYITGFTDSSGNFQLNAVPPGQYTAFAFEQIEPGAWYAFAYTSPLSLRVSDRGIPVAVGNNSSPQVQLKVIPASDTVGGLR